MKDSAGKLCPDIMLPRAIVSVQTETEGCIGYLGYPFQNKQGKSFVENLARSVDKEAKIAVVDIISAYLWNGYPKEPIQAGNTRLTIASKWQATG